MNQFFKYMQPTIIQATMDEELPERVRGRFFINFNVIGIQYFFENYLLQETSFGAPYLILKEDNWGLQLEDTSEGELIDIPRIYIDINDKFVNDEDNLFQSFVSQALMDNKIWVRGIDRFFAGMDYYTNFTLYNYLALTDQIEVPDFGARLPDYLDHYGNIQTKYWKDLRGTIYEDYNNLDYFNEKNNLLSNTYSDEELNNFYSNFCKIILENTRIDDELMTKPKNQIYNLVLNYYKNFKNDCGINSIGLILNSAYTIDDGSTTTCGCNSTSTTGNEGNISTPCYTLYQEAMENWLKTMLGDYEFYEDWFRIRKVDEEFIPNDILIEKLLTFLEEFISLQHTLMFLKQSKWNCECPSPSSFSENECNYNIIRNYMKILNWVFEDEIDSNINKTKIYGEQFGELLPLLQF